MKKGDTARKIIVTLMESGKPYRISKDCFAVFTAKKPDGNILFHDCAIVGNSIEYTLRPQSTAAEGEVLCEMRLYGPNSALITSPRFTIFVDDTVYNDGDSVESSDEFSALTALIAQTFAVKENLEEMLDLLSLTEENVSKLQEDVSWLHHDFNETKEEVETELHSIRETYGFDIALLDGYIDDLFAEAELAKADILKLQKDIGAIKNDLADLVDRVEDLPANSAFAVVNGKVCVEAARVGGENWQMLEVAAVMDEPYLDEYGWKCAGDDGTTDFYRWVYRCMTEGFSVPYRSILVDGVVYEFATELDERNAEFAQKVKAAPLTSYGGMSPSEWIKFQGVENKASFFCLPLVQFGNMTDAEIINGIARVRLDNPGLCFPPIRDEEIVRGADGKAKYCFCVYRTEETAERINGLIAAEQSWIDDLVEEYCGVKRGETLTEEQKKKVAKVIHDYIIIAANPAIDGAGGDVLPTVFRPTMYAVIDPTQRALCDGYAQAFNYFARKYGIHSIAMTGMVYHMSQGQMTQSGHVWNAVNFEDEYGTYSTDPATWSPIDVYWDEPLHEASMGKNMPDGDVFWKYFLNPTSIFTEVGTEWSREINIDSSYGSYPFEGEPTAQYDGFKTEEYEW